MMKAVEDETNLSTTDTKPTPSKSSKSSKSASKKASSLKKKKKRATKHRSSRRHQSKSKTAAAAAQAQKQKAPGAVADAKKKKSSKDAADKITPNSLCLGIGFFIQLFLAIGALIGCVFSYTDMDKSLQIAFLVLVIAQLELLAVLLLTACVKALAWATIVNHVVFFIVELGYAIYVTIKDLPEHCHDEGCSCLHGTLLHRVIFVGTCVIFGGVHAILSCCISVGVCLNKVEKEEINVEAQKPLPSKAAEPVLPRKTRWISETETQSRSSASVKSRKRHSAAQKVSLSMSSWNTLPTKSSDATSFAPPPPTPSTVSSYPTDSSQKLTSVTSSDYPYCPPAVSTASSCPYSAALVAQPSKQVRAAVYQPPCSTPNPFIYGQQQPPSAVNASDDVTVNVTYPSVTSVGGTKEYASVTVRIPSAYPQQGYPQQQQQLPPLLQPQVSIQRHHRRAPMAYYPYPDNKAQSVKTAKGFGNAGSELSSFNISQTSEPNSMVLPSSFASQDENAGQRIFTANTPTSKRY